MKKTLYIIPVILASVFMADSVRADDSFEIKNFSTHISIAENGTVRVDENIETEFSQLKHGIFRDIPTTGIKIEPISITDANGAPYQYKQIDFSSGIRYQIGDPDKQIIGPQTYKISYDVKKVLRFYPDHDEFYWNATGNEWPVNINSASATVYLPAKVKNSKELQYKCFTGKYGNDEGACSFRYDDIDNSVTFVSDSGFQPYNGMTIAVWFPPSTFEHPTALDIKTNPADAKLFLNDKFNCKTPCFDDSIMSGTYNLKISKFGYKTITPETLNVKAGTYYSQSFDLKPAIWFLMLIGLLFLTAFAVAAEPVITYFRKGRDPGKTGVLVPQYEQPDNLSPAETGTVFDERVDLRDLSSTIVDLAVRGYLIIKVLPDAKGFLFKKDDYELIKIENPKPKGKRALTAFESDFMDDIFGESTSKKISDMENEFYKNIPILQKSLYEKLTKDGYFPKSPNSIRMLYLGKGFAAIIIGIILIQLELPSLHTFFSLALIANGILTLSFSGAMPRKTEKGTKASEHILGFRHYMEVAEKDRLKFQENENIFYELLPFAMALNVADKWSNAFQNAFNNPPDWYQGVGTGHFYPIAFTHTLSSMATSMNSAFMSRPGGNGGSGFSGGGFSGGGFGGGGGGSW